MTIFHLIYINIASLILQKYISIQGRETMKHQQNYNNIIQIFDSEDQQPPNNHLTPSQSSELKKKVQQMLKDKNQKSKDSRSYKPQVTGKLIQYQDITNFKDFQVTNNLSQHLRKLTTFLQYAQKNVLFIFGPSGCGKTILTLSALQSNALVYELVKQKEQQNDYGETVYEDAVDMMYRILSSQDRIRQKIYVMKDFPISVEEMPFNYVHKYKIFKENVHHLISNINNRHKYIFILNSQIYSSYYLLSESSETKAINLLANVSAIKMQAYPVREMKKVISRFINKNPHYSNITNHSQSLQEIVTQANGDARKALNLIYTKKIREISRSTPPFHSKQKIIHFFPDPKDYSIGKKHQKQFSSKMLKQPEQQKEQQKVSIFHALGKLLYAKRYNIYYNPHDKKNKKDNKISCFYTEEQIDKLNPKFYFKPVQLLEKCHLNLNICTDLLQQNFLNRYGKVKDICKMYSIFRYADSYLEDSLNKFEVKQHMEQHLKELITWGIIVYNKNTIKQTSFNSIQRSKNNIYQKIIDKKTQIIKTFYLIERTPLAVVKRNHKDIIEYAYYLKTAAKPTLIGTFQQKLLQIIFDNGKRSNSIVGSTLQRQINAIQDEQQQVASQNCNKLNKITESLSQELSKKNRIIEMMIEDSDQSDIDSQ